MRFEKLEVWRRAARLSAELYTELEELRIFSFRDQITKSGLSIASNIAEGSERGSDRDYARFLSFARGSCAELRTQIYIGMKAGFINEESGKHWLNECDQISRMLHTLKATIASEPV